MADLEWVAGVATSSREKEIWLSPMTKTPTPTENSKTKGQHKNATKKIDYTTIVDRLTLVKRFCPKMIIFRRY